LDWKRPCFIESRVYEDALSAFVYAKSINPQNTETLYFIGQALDGLENYNNAFIAYQQALQIDANNVKAQFNIGMMYRYGDGVEKNQNKAVYWIKLAAENGLKDAQNNLGLWFLAGESVDADPLEAQQWLLKAARQGDSSSMVSLGYIEMNGLVGEKNYQTAYQWFMKASELGDPYADINLAELHQWGLGIPEDKESARRYYIKAARMGVREAVEYLQNNNIPFRFH
jgi:TPR repeat protein